MTFSKANQRMVFILSRRTRLSDFTFNFHFHALEKEMATHLCSCLENARDAGARWAAVCGVAQSRTRLKRLCSSSSSMTYNQECLHESEEYLNLCYSSASCVLLSVFFLVSCNLNIVISKVEIGGTSLWKSYNYENYMKFL